MPGWMLGVLIFLVILFASLFALALLLIWLVLRRYDDADAGVEAGYAEGEEYWEGEYWEEEDEVLEPVGALDGVMAEEPGAETVVTGFDAVAEDTEEDEPAEEREAAADAGEDVPGPGGGLASAGEGAPDDLKRIDGIGPKIDSVLQAAGITTYAQLAAADPGHIESILEAEGAHLLRLADPVAWSKQAEVAATGDWDALEKLQASLRDSRV